MTSAVDHQKSIHDLGQVQQHEEKLRSIRESRRDRLARLRRLQNGADPSRPDGSE